jgi:4-amino-4-deoxy-L-arabinose transferase-like glycosyltransferase
MMNKTSNVRQFERPFGEKTRLVERQDIIHIAILVTIALVIGVYLIATTVLIAKDGTFYIELAKSIADNPVEAIRNIPSWGYPFLIHLMHKMTGLFYDATSLQGWIISAQAVSLISKVIASIALYFVGSYFVGSRLSFWGVLILSVLPDSVEYGSDVLSNWPNIMFLAIGFLLLLLGSRFRKNWMFGWAGITTGLGYLVRPECGQVILYGSGWLLFNLIWPQEKIRRTKAAGALILLLAGFAVIAIPYMRSKGYVFPRQGIWKLPAILSMSNDSIGSAFNTNICLSRLSMSKTMGNKTLTTNMCETLMYYFIPALLVGCYYYFRKQSKTLEQAFYAAAFIVLNIVMLSWQLSCQHVLSRRYTLALVAFTVFYIPVGLYIIAGWINKRTSKGGPITEEDRQRPPTLCFAKRSRGVQRWFYILLIIGIAICLPKLFKFTGTQKYGYRDAATWLGKNTAPADVIAVPDKRITFYAERKGLEYGEQTPEQADYVVRIVKSGDEKLGLGKTIKEEYSTWVDKRKKKGKLVIYKMIR